MVKASCLSFLTVEITALGHSPPLSWMGWESAFHFIEELVHSSVKPGSTLDWSLVSCPEALGEVPAVSSLEADHCSGRLRPRPGTVREGICMNTTVLLPDV